MVKINSKGFKSKKYKIVKSTSAFIIGAGILCGLLSYTIADIKDIPYTSEDIQYISEFKAEYEELKDEPIVFNNEELEIIIKNTGKNLSEIDSLSIEHKLSNNDLSDLKYLTNLDTLLICENDIDCEDLKFNQKLTAISIINSKISNSEYLPNSIRVMLLINSNVLDKEFSLPYCCMLFESSGTIFNNLHLKNQNALKELIIKVTPSVIDFNNFKNCSELNKITLQECANVINSDYLANINPSELVLDDFAAIWMTKDLYYKLNIDNIYNSIISDEMTEEEKIEAITIYILDNLEYSERLFDGFTENKEQYEDEIVYYNTNPIYTIFSKKEHICVNYASLFKALVNRSNIENYKISNDSHAWNLYKDNDNYVYTDTTILDEFACNLYSKDKDGNEVLYLFNNVSSKDVIESGKSEELCFYKFDPDSDLASIYIYENIDNYPLFLESLNKNIGYIHDEGTAKILNISDRNYHKSKIFYDLCYLLILIGVSSNIINAILNKDSGLIKRDDKTKMK